MNWKEKGDGEDYEIKGFIEAYKQLPQGRKFIIKSKREKPDYVLEDSETQECFGIELTSVYLNDRSVPDRHIARPDNINIPYCENSIERYQDRLFQTIL